MVSRCCNPCVSFLCTLLYTGSSVLQINESPVCSLDKVPQALACDWLLACLQVTLPFCKLHQSTASSMLLILLIKQSGDVFFSFKECVRSGSHFKSYVIDGASAVFDLLFFCVFCHHFPQDHVNHFRFFSVLLFTLIFVVNLICCSYQYAFEKIGHMLFLHSLKQPHAHTH